MGILLVLRFCLFRVTSGTACWDFPVGKSVVVGLGCGHVCSLMCSICVGQGLGQQLFGWMG